MYKLLVTIGLVCGLCSGDQIHSLPGFDGPIAFKQYSGYLQTSASHFLHYWFVESQSQPWADPLIVWLNGGPGCSSMKGILTEMGPFLVQDDGATLRANPHAWNKEANMLFLESPAGVGFSYSTNGTATNDDQTTNENYAALKAFMTEFPQFNKHDIYIAGESYGGVYVPLFVAKIIDGLHNYPLNLKGMAIGNGCVHMQMLITTLTEFMYNHGIISETDLTNFTACCGGCFKKCNFGALQGYCRSYPLSVVIKAYISSGLNVYAFYDDCYHDTRSLQYKTDLKDHMSSDELEERLVGTSKGAFPCLDEQPITEYLNRTDVRNALFIPSHVDPWAICSGINYTKQHNGDMLPQVRKALSHGLRVMLYYGDTDMACNYLLGQRFSAAVGQTLQSDKQTWHYDNKVAGFVTKYDQLQFVTVRGAGHSVPIYNPGAAFFMIDKFLKDRDLTPPRPPTSGCVSLNPTTAVVISLLICINFIAVNRA